MCATVPCVRGGLDESARDVGAAAAEHGADGPQCHSATVAYPGDGAHPSGRIPHGPHAKRTTITHVNVLMA